MLRPEELLVTRQHQISVSLPATLLWWRTERRRRDALKGASSQEGAGQAFGWEDRHPEGPERHWELARLCRLSVVPWVPRATLPTHPPGLPFLLPLPHSNEGFPGHTPQTPRIAPFGVTISAIFYTFLPAHAVPVPDLPCLCQRFPRPAVLIAGFLAGLRSPFRFCPLESRCPRAEVAALPPAGLGGGGAPAPCALCSYWTGLCVPLSANDGAGGNWRPGPARSRDEAQTVSERLWE